MDGAELNLGLVNLWGRQPPEPLGLILTNGCGIALALQEPTSNTLLVGTSLLAVGASARALL